MAANVSSHEALLRAFSKGAGAFVALASFLAFLSTALDIGPAIRFFGLIPIHPNQQALVAMTLGLALFLQHVKPPWGRRLSLALSVPMAVFCMLGVAEIVVGWPLGLNNVDFPQGFGDLSGDDLAFMTFPSALELALLALALSFAHRAGGWASDLLTLTALGYIFITALIVALQIQHRYGTTFALPTGVLLLSILALGVLCSHPDRGVMRVLTRETMVGVVLRRLLPTALLVPLLIAWSWMEGQRIGLFDAPQGMFFAELVMIVVTLAVVGWNVIPLARIERARDEAIRALRESETRASRLAAIVEASEDGITTYAPDSLAITFWSKGAERLWGWTSEEALGNRAGFLAQPSDRNVVAQTFETLRSGKPAAIPHIRGTRRDGTLIDVSVGLFPIRDPEGRVVAFGSIQRDITEQRKMLIEMARKSAELSKSQELNALKDHFLSTISHEMKTPLSLITGYAELLEDACPDETMIEGIKEGSRRLSEHINNILDYSALISGTLPLYKTDLNVSEVAHHVEGLMREAFEEKDIGLSVEVAPETPVIEGDFRRISQILLELLENAQKFTPEGGKAGMRIAPQDGQVRIDVWNTGEGIPEEAFGRIWEAFSQLATEDAFRKGGLGLGLTIVKRLVELHGGRVAVTSQIGQGATFSVFLPVGIPKGPHGPTAPEGESQTA